MAHPFLLLGGGRIPHVCVFGSGAPVGKWLKWPLALFLPLCPRENTLQEKICAGPPQSQGRRVSCACLTLGMGWSLIPLCPWSGSQPCLSSLSPRDKDYYFFMALPPRSRGRGGGG